MRDTDDIDPKRMLKLLVLADPAITAECLQRKLRRRGVGLTLFAIDAMKRSFLHDIQVIRQAGLMRPPKVRMRTGNGI